MAGGTDPATTCGVQWHHAILRLQRVGLVRYECPCRVDCYTCGAQAGQLCYTATGYRASPHKGRLDAAGETGTVILV